MSLTSYLIYPAIQLHEDTDGGDGGFLIKCTVPKQVLVATFEDDVWLYFPGNNVTDYDLITSNVVRGGLKLNKNELDPATGKNRVAIYCRMPSVTRSANGEMSYDMGEYSAEDENGVQKTLLYSGRNNQELFFSYYSYRGAGSRTKKSIIHDLSLSNLISVDEARIEILGVSDNAIEYRVLQAFSSDDW
ncbi:MAG: hypothetical protein KDI33_06710 [Halioglobus sp.]|nr:hypothetical protein [Halioglobus sp.]